MHAVPLIGQDKGRPSIGIDKVASQCRIWAGYANTVNDVTASTLHAMISSAP